MDGWTEVEFFSKRALLSGKTNALPPCPSPRRATPSHPYTGMWMFLFLPYLEILGFEGGDRPRSRRQEGDNQREQHGGAIGEAGHLEKMERARGQSHTRHTNQGEGQEVGGGSGDRPWLYYHASECARSPSLREDDGRMKACPRLASSLFLFGVAAHTYRRFFIIGPLLWGVPVSAETAAWKSASTLPGKAGRTPRDSTTRPQARAAATVPACVN